MDIGTIISIGGFALAIFGAVAGWLSSRRAELRRDQVHAWVNESIACIQTVVLLVKPDTLQMPHETRIDRLEEQAVAASVLLEQGRMFFDNQLYGQFGFDKEYAYRGIRPVILDQLLVIHELALEYGELEPKERVAAFDLGVQCLKRFVTLAQTEVGRDRSASVYAAAGGDGATFRVLLEDYQASGKLAPALDLLDRTAIQTLRERWTRMSTRSAARRRKPGRRAAKSKLSA